MADFDDDDFVQVQSTRDKKSGPKDWREPPPPTPAFTETVALLRYLLVVEADRTEATIKYRNAFVHSQESFFPMFLLEYRKVPVEAQPISLQHCRHLAWQFVDPRGEDTFAVSARALRKLPATIDVTVPADQQVLVSFFVRTLDVCREHFYSLKEDARASFSERPEMIALSDSLLGGLPWLGDVKKFNQLRNDAVFPLTEQIAKQPRAQESVKKRSYSIKKYLNDVISQEFVTLYDDATDKAKLRELFYKKAEDGVKELTGNEHKLADCEGLTDIGQTLHIIKSCKLKIRDNQTHFDTVKKLLLAAPQLLNVFAAFSASCGHKFILPVFEDRTSTTTTVKFASPLSPPQKKLPLLPEIGLIFVDFQAHLLSLLELWQAEAKANPVETKALDIDQITAAIASTSLGKPDAAAPAEN